MKRLLSLLLAVMMVISMTACGNKESADSKEDSAENSETDASEEEESDTENSEAEETADGTHVIVDHGGFEVEVPNKIERIVVCDILPMPSVISVFFDSADKIVGMSSTSMTAAENSLLGELYPEILEAETGFIEGGVVNVEELMKLEPDVVIYSTSSAEIGEQLRNAGFAAVGMSVNKWEYDCIETLNNWILLLSELFPDNDKTEIVEKYSDEVYKMVQKRLVEIPEEERENVFFLFKYDDSNIMTSGSSFFGHWWATATGSSNVAAEITTDNQVTVNMEQIYDWNPSVIFVSNFTTAGVDDIYNNTVGNYDWSAIDAVKNERVYKMPLGMYRSYTPGVDTPITLMWMAKTTYPEYFEDIDITEETMKYYKEVFGVELTAEQAEMIFNPNADAGSGF